MAAYRWAEFKTIVTARNSAIAAGGTYRHVRQQQGLKLTLIRAVNRKSAFPVDKLILLTLKSPSLARPQVSARVCDRISEPIGQHC